MNQQNILAVKMEKKEKSQTVTVDYFYPELNRNRSEQIQDVPHPDFNKAVMDLSPFLAKVFHADDCTDFLATGFKLAKENYVILTGKMVTTAGTTVGIATPQINLEEESVYEFENKLSDAVSTVCVEALQLLNGTKLGVKQLTIDDSIEQNKKDEEDILSDQNNNKELNDEAENDNEDSNNIENREEEDDFLNNNPPDIEEFTFPDDLDKQESNQTKSKSKNKK